MTSISELARPQPSNGYRDFPTLQKHHTHTEGNSLAPPYNPSHSTSVFHPAVNSTANYPIFCGAFAQNWQTQYSEGMPIFVCRQKRNTSDNRGTLTGRHVSHNILASIPVINFYLTLGSCDPDFVDKFVKKYNLSNALIPYANKNLSGREKEQSFIDDFNEKWAFMGIIMNDLDTKSRYQKLFNVTVRGRCRSFNLWTTRIKSKYSKAQARDSVTKGDELYLTLKQEPIDNRHFVQPDGTTMPIFPQCDNTNMIWQIKATRRSVAANRRPTNIDERGSLQQHYHVAKVLSAVSKKPDEHYQRRAFREHTQMAALPMLEVAVHTGV